MLNICLCYVAEAVYRGSTQHDRALLLTVEMEALSDATSSR
jgi:hypothetical protein